VRPGQAWAAVMERDRGSREVICSGSTGGQVHLRNEKENQVA
jgi:hypothetical protein